MDSNTLVGALGSLKAASDIVRGISAASTSLEKAELKLRIAELADLLVGARMAVVEAQEEIISLRAQVAALRARADDRSKLVKRGNVYFFNEDAGESGPYCPRCCESTHTRMPVTKLPAGFAALGTYQCPECKAVL